MNSVLSAQRRAAFLILLQRCILFTKPSLVTKSLSAVDFLVEQAAQGFLLWEEGREERVKASRKGGGGGDGGWGEEAGLGPQANVPVVRQLGDC